eukprot:1346727-Pyramimonas_sp.AAC.1
MLPFALSELAKYGGERVFGSPFLHAGWSMQRLLELARSNPVVVPDNVRVELVTCAAVHLRCCALTGVTFTPKHHLIVHLVA